MNDCESEFDAIPPDSVANPAKFLVYSHEQAVQHILQRRSEKEQILYMITDEVLFNVWDAFCLSINDEHRDVYFPYLPQVFDLLIKAQNGDDLFDYLTFIEETRMDAEKGDALARRRAWRVVDILLNYRNTLFEEPDNTQVT